MTYDPREAATLHVTEPGSLFDVPPPRATPLTGRDREKVACLLWFAARNGIPDECAASFVPDGASERQRLSLVLKYRPRVAELHGEGCLAETGAKRPTGYGGTAKELRITAKGKDVLAGLGLDPLSRLLRAGKGDGA